MFGWFAIGLIVISFSFELAHALNAGAILTLIMAQILIIKAFATPWQSPQSTEVWLHLDDGSRPTGKAGAKVFASILADVYLRFAQRCFTVGCGFFAVSFVLRVLRTSA